jgi:hypothetical protein
MARDSRSPVRDRRSPLPGYWLACALAALLLLGGCAANGDFDRVRPELVSDDMHDWIGRDFRGSVRAIASAAPMTDDERLLRDLAYPLIEPPFDRNRWYSVLGEYGAGPARKFALPHAYVNPTTYWERLEARRRRSEASRYAQLIGDVRNDALRLDPFFAVARRVVDMDRRRAQTMAYVETLSTAERNNALFRINENIAAVTWVCRSLEGRIVAYRFALEHQAVAAPSPAAADGDHAIDFLQQRVAGHCRIASEPVVVSKG